jgi:hypothetical protein
VLDSTTQDGQEWVYPSVWATDCCREWKPLKKQPGRRKFDPARLIKLQELGKKPPEIAKILHCHVSRVYAHLAKLKKAEGG